MAEGTGDSGGKPRDSRVDRLRPDPSRPPLRARTLSGLWGDSDRPGFRRLYLTSALDTYAEFRIEDILGTVEIPPDRAPFLGEQATQVELRHDAAVDFTRTRRAGDVDEFDLDVRFGHGVARPRRRLARNATARARECRVLPPPTSFEWAECNPFPPGGGRPATVDGCPPKDTGSPCATSWAPCHTDAGFTQCGTCNTDQGATACGTCDTCYGLTGCGTCYTDPGATACGTCGTCVTECGGCHTDYGVTDCGGC